MSNDDPLKKKSQKGKHKNDIGKNNKKNKNKKKKDGSNAKYLFLS